MSENQGIKRSILFVEDDRVLSHLVKIYFRDMYEIVNFFSAESAIESIENYNFDLFLLDINLGIGMNGIDLLKHIRKIPHYIKTPAIAATAYALEGDKEFLLSNGFNGYIPKPFTKKELIDYVNKFMDESYEK